MMMRKIQEINRRIRRGHFHLSMPFVLLPLIFLPLSHSFIHSSLIKASQSTFIIIVIVIRKSNDEIIKKGKTFFYYFTIFRWLCVFVLYYILYSIYIHDFFKRNVIGRDNKRHHNYNQKKICVFCLFLFIYTHLAELSSLSVITKREMSQQHHEINWDAACDIEAAGLLITFND